MRSAFGVDHGEVSKGIRSAAAKLVAPKPKTQMAMGYHPRARLKEYAPSRDAARAKPEMTMEQKLQAKKDFYAKKNRYIKTGELP